MMNLLISFLFDAYYKVVDKKEQSFAYVFYYYSFLLN